MLKIATHDSATGEKSKGFISWLVTPFAKTQSKTIKDQYDAGCRSFDIRVKYINNTWYCAHGLWRSKRTALDILDELNSLGDTVQVCVTYEGNEDNEDIFKHFGVICQIKYTNIIFGAFCIKYTGEVKFPKVAYREVLYANPSYGGTDANFIKLDGRSWHTYIPIPWLWNFIYTRKHEFNEDRYTSVDFL